MEYRLAKIEEAMEIYEMVRETINEIYPTYYHEVIVRAFCEYHSKENILEDVKKSNTYVLLENSNIIGTGTINENHITRVYVSSKCQRKGYGTYIMNHLEAEIQKKYDKCDVDASLPACKLYYKLGYKTIDHGIWECGGGIIQIYEIMEKQLKKENKTTGCLRLRPYKPCDAKTIVSWIRDEMALRKWSADRYESYPITPEDMNQKYINSNGDCANPMDFYPMTAVDDSGVIGHLIMRYTDIENQILRFGFVIVDDTKRGKGYGKEMLQLALKYAFEILKVSKVTLGVFENNPSAYYCYKAAGFEEIQMEKEEYFSIMGENWKCIEMEINAFMWKDIS